MFRRSFSLRCNITKSVTYTKPSNTKRCRGLFMVADMDGTLTPTPTKSGGFLTPISKSPTFEPIRRFLQEGGTLIVETNAGTFPFDQIYKPLRSTLKELYDEDEREFHINLEKEGRTNSAPSSIDECYQDGKLILCPFSGAAMFVSVLNRETGEVEMKEDERFAKTARATCCTNSFEYFRWGKKRDSKNNKKNDDEQMNKNNNPCFDVNDPCYKDPTTFIPEAHVPELLDAIRGVICKTFALMDEDPTYLPSLSRKYREALPPVIAMRRELGVERFEKEVLSMENLLEYGRFLQASNNPLLDLQRVSGGNLVQINVLGTAMSWFDELWPESLRDELATVYSAHAKRQPNSTTLSKDQVNKGLPIRYLSAQRQRETELFFSNNNNNKNNSKHHHPVRYCWDFKLKNAIGFGDHPHFTDYPMTQFPPMPFVSLSQKKSEELLPDWPYKTEMIHVRYGEEDGTAKYLSALVDFCIKNNKEHETASNWWKPEFAVEVGKDLVH